MAFHQCLDVEKQRLLSFSSYKTTNPITRAPRMTELPPKVPISKYSVYNTSLFLSSFIFTVRVLFKWINFIRFSFTLPLKSNIHKNRSDKLRGQLLLWIKIFTLPLGRQSFTFTPILTLRVNDFKISIWLFK